MAATQISLRNSWGFLKPTWRILGKFFSWDKSNPYFLRTGRTVMSCCTRHRTGSVSSQNTASWLNVSLTDSNTASWHKVSRLCVVLWRYWFLISAEAVNILTGVLWFFPIYSSAQCPELGHSNSFLHPSQFTHSVMYSIWSGSPTASSRWQQVRR